MNTELLEAAQTYHKLGLPIIPFILSWNEEKQQYDKTNIGAWKKWQTEAQTEEEFNNLRWNKEGKEANAFGVLLGKKAKNGLYLTVVDYDVKGAVSEEAKKIGLKIVSELPITRVEETINKGLHYLYWSKTRVETDGTFHDKAGLELLGDSICLVAPSHGYRNIGSDIITELENTALIFFRKLQEKNLLPTPKKQQENTAQQGTAYSFNLSDIIDLTGFTQLGPNEYQGKHPVHDSTTEKNFCVNVKSNTWHCFRHHTGGGSLQFLAVKEGIIKCEESGKGALKGKKFKRTIELAIAQGLINPDVFDKKESQADRVYKLFLQSDVELFHDQNKTEYARIPYTTDAIDAIDGISETYISRSSTAPIEQDEKQAPETLKNCVNCVIASKETVRLQDEKFKTYLAHLLYEAEGKLANKESISQVILLLKYDAAHGKCYKLFNRVAPDPSGDGSIWLDMADAHNRAYHITKDGWTLESEVPILFRRYEHQKPLVVAAKNGDPRKLLPFVKIGINKDKKITAQNELLLLIQTASYIIPEIAHPVNAMFGCPGSHKSTAQRFIREVFDPSAAPLLRIPRDENAALQVLDHHYIPIFDNLDYLPRWLSDMLCGAVTGTGQESRILYTDAGSFIRSFRRCPMLNGLNLPPTKGDLLNRSILHPTEPNVERRTEKDLETEYQKVLPEILGGFLDVVVKALKIKDNVCVPKLFRLADFTEWGCALSVALGKTEQDFIDAMEENLNNQNTADIENNIVADAFLAYCKSSLALSATEDNPKTATPDVIFSLVEEKAKELNINVKNKRWPSAACYFTRKLNDSKNAIMASGWNYQVVPKGKNREMEIWYTPPEPKEETPPNTPKKYYENRYCSVECVKFDTKDCVDIHKFDKNSKSKLPVDCPGYQQASPGEEEY